MKKCPDCGMTIANQAIRCPKCKFNFAESEDTGAAEAVPAAAAAVSAAATGASMNVYINTKLMKDREYADSINKKCDEMIDKITSVCEKAYNVVYKGLR